MTTDIIIITVHTSGNPLSTPIPAPAVIYTASASFNAFAACLNNCLCSFVTFEKLLLMMFDEII